MRWLICAGGTGGGVYPALTVLRELRNDADTVLWIGGEGGMEADLVKREGLPFQAIPAAGVHGVGLRTLPGNVVKLGRGALAARRLIGQFRPDALLFTGGFVAVPVALAGWRVPTALFVPDIEPGLALQALARFADVIAVPVEESRRYFAPGKRVVVTGYPVRPELSGWTRQAGQQALGLDPALPTLLVAGGSKGARSINQALAGCLAEILEFAQVVHLSGAVDWATVQQHAARLPERLRGRYHPAPYLHSEQMGAALASADLAVSRAGASVLGEYPAFGLPALLVPYPYAWRYQKVNAEYLVQHGAARLVVDAELGQRLLAEARDLLQNPAALGEMRAAVRSLARPDAAAHIAGLVRGLAQKEGLPC